MDRKTIVVVSGLPRSGTSMMMKMLQAGGMAVLTDELRQPDEDNPQGYYEFEQVKWLSEDSSWLESAQGKAVKVISALLPGLPSHHTYKIVFMTRNMQEILASQKQMLIRRGEPTDAVSDDRMSQVFQKHLNFVRDWISRQPNITALYADYNQVLQHPSQSAEMVNRFLDSDLDVQRMAQAVDPTLYRQRCKLSDASQDNPLRPPQPLI